jgi:methyl-accepting chemotaxis protein
MTVSLSSISYLGYYKAKDSMYKSFEEQAYNQLDNINTNVDIWISGKQETQRSLAEIDTLKTANINESVKLSVRLAEKNKNPDAFAFIDAKGFLHLPGVSIPLGKYPHFQKAIKGETVTVDPVGSASKGIEGTPIVLTATPVYDYNGKIIGVSNGGNPIADLIEVISKVKLGKTGHALVFTKDGTVVVGEKKEDTLKKNISDMKNRELTNILKESMNGKKGIKEVDINGKKNMVIYGKATKMDWGIMILIPVSEAYASANQLLNFLLPMTIVFILISAIVNFYSIRKTLKPISIIKGKIDEIAKNEGDLTARLPLNSKDEMGELSQSFNLMLENMQSLIEDILQKSEVVTTSSNILLENMEQISITSREITTNIQQATEISEKQMIDYETNLDSMKEINDTLAEITTASAVISNEAKKTSHDAVSGDENVKSLVSQMSLIQEAVNDSAKTVEKLGERSGEVGKIVEMITEISSQTNLLALNANIEAARAGEHGKGFSVVAEEVRKLAERSTLSANQISQIIFEIQNDTYDAIQNMKKVITEIEVGMQGTNEFGNVFQNIVESINTVANQIERNLAATEQLLKSTNNIEEVIKKSVDFSEESMANYRNIANASEEQFSTMIDIRESVKSLTNASAELKEKLNKFNI